MALDYARMSRNTTKNLQAWRRLSQSERTAMLAAARDRLGIKPERKSAMADDTTIEPLERRLAGVLSELEDAEVELTNKEHKLAKDLREVQGELERLQAVKAAILGKPKTTTSTRQPYAGNAARTKANKEKVTAFVAALANGQTFSARDLATAIGIDLRGIGPILGGMVRGGFVTEAEGESETGHKLYQRA